MISERCVFKPWRRGVILLLLLAFTGIVFSGCIYHARQMRGSSAVKYFASIDPFKGEIERLDGLNVSVREILIDINQKESCFRTVQRGRNINGKQWGKIIRTYNSNGFCINEKGYESPFIINDRDSFFVSLNGQYVACGYNKIEIYNLLQDKLESTVSFDSLNVEELYVYGECWIADDKIAFYNWFRQIFVVDLNTKEFHHIYDGERIVGLSAAPNGKHFAFRDIKKKKICIYNSDTLTSAAEISYPTQYACFTWSPDGDIFIYAQNQSGDSVLLTLLTIVTGKKQEIQIPDVKAPISKIHYLNNAYIIGHTKPHSSHKMGKIHLFSLHEKKIENSFNIRCFDFFTLPGEDTLIAWGVW